MNTKKNFAVAMAMLAETFNRELTAPAVDTYWLALEDVTPEQLRAAVKKAALECKFMPTPAELREFALGKDWRARQESRRQVDARAGLGGEAARGEQGRRQRTKGIPMSNYPRGKLKADDEGQLKIAMVVKGNTLIIDFGKPVAWVGLGLNEVRAMREGLQRYEAQLEKVSG